MKNETLKTFKYNNLNVQIGLALVTDNNGAPADRYREFWIDTPEAIFKRLET